MIEAKEEKPSVFTCCFCGRRQDEVLVLVQGPTSRICNVCIEFCVEMVREKYSGFCFHPKAVQIYLNSLAEKITTGEIKLPDTTEVKE